MSQTALDLDLTQRWRNGFDSYVPARSTIDTKLFRVDRICPRDAKDFVVKHHYSHSFVYDIASYGLIANDIRAGWLLNYEKYNLDEILKLLQLHNINMLIPNVDDQIWNDNYFIDKLKNSGYTLCAWGAKSTSDVIKMNNLGISGMTVNWPTKASKVIE